MFRTLVIAVFAISAVFHNSTSSFGGESAQRGRQIAELTRTSDGGALVPGEIEAALSESSVMARLSGGQKLSFFSARLTSRDGARVLLSASSDMVIATCLDGRIEAGDASAEAGELLLWLPGQPKPQSYAYDIRRFLASATIDFGGVLTGKLRSRAVEQDRLIFWGLLQRTRINAQSLKLPVVEPERRRYLRRPAIMRLRLAHANVASLAGGVAKAFVAALVAGDATVVADLLNPALFVPKGGGLGGSAWQALRTAFARNLLRQPWKQRFGDAEVVKGQRSDIWTVKGRGALFAITVNSFDGMVFVNGIRPVGATAKANQITAQGNAG